jgi:hypothetical protein
MTLSGRAERAVEVLKAGGYFREALETHWNGGEKFRTRLRTASGAVVKGFGFAVKAELESAGMLVSRECAASSTWPHEWILKGGT